MLRLCAQLRSVSGSPVHLLPKPPSRSCPTTPGWALDPDQVPGLSAPVPTLPARSPCSALRRQGAPCERPILATRRPLPLPRRDGSGAPGAMRGQGRKESLSDSRDLDGSYDQLTGEWVDRGSREGG